MPWVHQISMIGERRLTAELALWNLEAVQRFERSSNKLTKYLAWVTVALVLLTVAIAYYSFVLAKLALDGLNPSSLRARSQLAPCQGGLKNLL